MLLDWLKESGLKMHTIKLNNIIPLEKLVIHETKLQESTSTTRICLREREFYGMTRKS